MNALFVVLHINNTFTMNFNAVKSCVRSLNGMRVQQMDKTLWKKTSPGVAAAMYGLFEAESSQALNPDFFYDKLKALRTNKDKNIEPYCIFFQDENRADNWPCAFLLYTFNLKTKQFEIVYEAASKGRGSMLRDGEPGSMVKRMTVYVGNWGDESIPFDDAIPFSLT